MQSFPFAISQEAAAWIKSILKAAEEDPEYFDGTIPLLGFCDYFQRRDKEGKLFEAYSGRFFEVGWISSDCITEENIIIIEILGYLIYTIPNMSEILDGKEIVLRTVEVGYPNPPDRVIQMLLAE